MTVAIQKNWDEWPGNTRGKVFSIQEVSSSMSVVDVVIPCYNYARYLPACVDSVLLQPGVRTRVLVTTGRRPNIRCCCRQTTCWLRVL
jgi:hypothetical protein